MLSLTIRAIGDGEFSPAGLKQVNTWLDLSGTACAYGYEGPNARWIRWPGYAAFRFDREGLTTALAERPVDDAELSAFFRRIVEPLVLQAVGWETLHASGVISAGGVTAFCGDREAGKSTIAYSLARRGYRQFSDDALAVDIRPGGVRALRLAFGVRLRSEAASFFGFPLTPQQPQNIGAVRHPDTRESLLEPLSSVIVLRRASTGNPTIERLTPGAAMTALLCHAHCFSPNDPEERRRLLRQYLEITATVPVYELRFAAGLEKLDSVLSAIESVVGVYPGATA